MYFNIWIVKIVDCEDIAIHCQKCPVDFRLENATFGRAVRQHYDIPKCHMNMTDR